MSVKLSNRQAVSAKVADFVASAVIPEEMARQIFHAEVNDAYVEYLEVRIVCVCVCVWVLNSKRKILNVPTGIEQKDGVCEEERNRQSNSFVNSGDYHCLLLLDFTHYLYGPPFRCLGS
jgi:hypothetical protein